MRILPSLFLVATVSQLGATDCGQVIRDSSFDLWCGDDLCAWKTTRGEVKRVPTWNEGDSGVELVGDDVAIQQLSPVNSGDGTCIKFSLVANVDDRAEVFLNIDVEGDGTIERMERIPSSSWKPLSFDIAIAPPYDGVRFEITKQGTGKAQLANIGARTAKDECGGRQGLDPGPRRNGSICNIAAPSQCASGICAGSPTLQPDPPFFGGACLGCNPSAPNCTGGQVCGLADAFSPVFAIPVQCVPAASKELGEQCLSDPECASGKCKFPLTGSIGACSSCTSDTDCTGGETCEPSWTSDGTDWAGPYVCGANASKGTSGAACGNDDDCASGHCNGAVRSVCSDGRTCISPAECPFGADGNDPLQNGACDTVGLQGGTCQ